MMIPPLWQHFCDDAAIFPPGNASLAQAVIDHERRSRSDHAALVGPLVVSAAVLPELDPLLAGQPEQSLAIAVTVPAVELVVPVLDQLADRPVLHLRMLEVAIGDGDPEEALDLVRAGLGGTSTPVAIEVPRDDRRTATLDALGEHAVTYGWIAKFRTGGGTPETYPSATELSEVVVGCVARDLPFKCTAGLHHAVRHVDRQTGFDEHGFANVLLATHRALVGDRPDDLVTVLDERDAATVADALHGLDSDQVVRLREQFRSFGTCSIEEPLADLIHLGLLEPAAGSPGMDPLHHDELLHPDDHDARSAP